jgi:hypothetical protein
MKKYPLGLRLKQIFTMRLKVEKACFEILTNYRFAKKYEPLPIEKRLKNLKETLILVQESINELEQETHNGRRR